MKRLSFGTLFNILYQARRQKIKRADICRSVFLSFGASDLNCDNDTFLGHLKNGHDSVPNDVIFATRSSNIAKVEVEFQKNVLPLISDSYRIAVCRAIKDVIREDTTLLDSTIIGYDGFEKSKILSSNVFNLTSLLASVFYFSITMIDNKSCRSAIREIDKNYVANFISNGETIHFESKTPENLKPLSKTLHDSKFNTTFMKVLNLNIYGLAHPSTAQIYSVNINNYKFIFRDLKKYLLDNIGNYILSRSKIAEYETENNPMAAGSRAMLKFIQTYKTNAKSVLGELLLYIFLEQELGAPKIMSKIEINDTNGVVSKSDGVHLFTGIDNNELFHQLVFGASDIVGDLHTAVDRAFDKIKAIERNSDSELQIVEDALRYNIFSPETNAYIASILIPKKIENPKPDMSFGIFLGYTINIDSAGLSINQYRDSVKKQMECDISNLQTYIQNKIQSYSLSGYNFYFYVMPFNDATSEKQSIIDEMLEEVV